MTSRHSAATEGERRDRDRRFAIGVARAFGGAIFFSLPLLMTMEMWWLGFHMDRLRLALFMVVMIPVLVILDHYSGFEETTRWAEDVLDGLVGYGVGFASAITVLGLLAVLDPDQSLSETIGKICLLAIPAAFGAVLASSQLGGGGEGEDETRQQALQRRAGYPAQLFFMVVGALFLSFNIAPTEEVLMIAYMATPWHGIALALVSMAMMHGFVYGVGFRGAPSTESAGSGWSLFLRFTLVGYAASLLISAYTLWSFGRFADTALANGLLETIVLAFPASLGAAGARLIL